MRSNFAVFVVRSALNVDGWMVVRLGREFCLGPPGKSSMCFVYSIG